MELVTLEAQGEKAIIVPAAGFQCLGYSVSSLEIVAGPDTPEAWKTQPFRSGIPILFPWPGRVADGRFTWRGRELTLPINDPSHHCAIHGLIYDRAFTITRSAPYYVSGRLDSRDDPELSRTWPFPFVLELDYELGAGLRLRAAVENVGGDPMPMGFGAHPYFRAPLGRGGERAAMQVEVAAERRWVLDQRLLPTGRLEALAGKFDLRSPRRFDAQNYDDAFQLAPAGSGCVGRLIDPNLKLAIEVNASAVFRQAVLYAPPQREIAAIEPYTCAPDAFNLAARGIDSGVIELQPGSRFQAQIEIRVSAP